MNGRLDVEFDADELVIINGATRSYITSYARYADRLGVTPDYVRDVTFPRMVEAGLLEYQGDGRYLDLTSVARGVDDAIAELTGGGGT